MLISTKKFLLIITSITVTTNAKFLFCPRKDGKLERYDPDKAQCCFGVEDKQEGKRCCVAEERFYFEQDQICCDKLYNKVTDDKINFCCGDKKLVSGEDNGLCCRSSDRAVYYSNITGDAKNWYDCCGSDVYDFRKEQCCSVSYAQPVMFQVQPFKYGLECCGLEVINRTQWKCGKNGVPLTYEEDQCFINDKWQKYKTNEQRCCFGESTAQESLHNVSESDPHYRCCGNRLILAKNEKCCPRGHAIPNQTHNACCGEGYIDKRKEKCCNGQPVSITDPKKKICCGSQLMDYATQNCCAGHPYNRLTQQCCGATILSVKDKCCGNAKQERGDKCCFNKVLIKDVSDEHNACCYNDYTKITKTYNNKTQECRNGKINTKRADPLLRPCGDDIYHAENDLCCNQKKYIDGIKNRLQCCGAGTKAYSSDKQMCCFSEVFEIPENSGMCCRGVGYRIDDEVSPCKPVLCGGNLIDPEKFICCQNKKKSLMKGDSCCGSLPYYKEKSTCCADRNLFDGANRACCGSEAFNSDGKMCCGDLEIIRTESNKRKCCGDLLPYSPADNLCDDNGHVSLFYRKNPPPKTVCSFDEEEMLGVLDHWPMFYCSHKMVIFGKVKKIVLSGKRTIIFLTGVHSAAGDRNTYWPSKLRIVLPDFCRDNTHLIDNHLMITTDRLPTRPTLSFRSAHKYFVTTLNKDLRHKVKSYKKCQQLLG